MGAGISRITTGCFKATSEENRVEPNEVESNEEFRLLHVNSRSKNWEMTARLSEFSGQYIIELFVAMMIGEKIKIYRIFVLKMVERPSRIILELNETTAFSVTIYVGETIRHSTTWESTEYVVQEDNGFFTFIMKKTSDGTTIHTSPIDVDDEYNGVSSSAAASSAPEVVPTNESAQGGSGGGLDTLSAQSFSSNSNIEQKPIQFYNYMFTVSKNEIGHKVLAMKEPNFRWRTTDFGLQDNIADIRIIVLSETELLFVITQKSGHSCVLGFTKECKLFTSSMTYITTQTVGGKLFRNIRVKGIESSKTGIDRDGKYFREILVSYTDESTRVFHYASDGTIRIPK